MDLTGSWNEINEMFRYSVGRIFEIYSGMVLLPATKDKTVLTLKRWVSRNLGGGAEIWRSIENLGGNYGGRWLISAHDGRASLQLAQLLVVMSRKQTVPGRSWKIWSVASYWNKANCDLCLRERVHYVHVTRENSFREHLRMLAVTQVFQPKSSVSIVMRNHRISIHQRWNFTKLSCPQISLNQIRHVHFPQTRPASLKKKFLNPFWISFPYFNN